MTNRVNRHIRVTTQPAAEPVSVAEFKSFLGALGDDKDELIENLLKTARIACENFTNTSFINTTYKQIQDDFEYDGLSQYSIHNQLAFERDIQTMANKQGYIKLQARPVSSIIEVVTYNSENISSAYSSDNYALDTAGNKILINDDAAYPSDLRTRSGIEVEFVAGYGAAASDVPYAIRHAIMIYTQSLFDFNRNRDALIAEAFTLPEGAKQLLMPYRFEIGING